MVQFIFTPWRDRQELLTVRGQFYPAAPDLCGGHVPKSPGAPEPGSGRQNIAAFGDQTHNRQELRHSAVARVSMWVQRGNCPHLVESTALLVAAILSDEGFQEDRDHQGSSAFAVRAAYSTAFSRFVTGLMDMQQDKQRKMSMFSIAKTIGLPATFVELRHQATHEQLPSLTRLRSAADKALVWIWDHYWQHIEAQGPFQETRTDACYESMVQFLNETDTKDGGSSLVGGEGFRDLISRWGKVQILKTLMEVQDQAEDGRMLLKALQVTRLLMEADEGKPRACLADLKDPDAVMEEITRTRHQLATEPHKASSNQENQTHPHELASDGDIGWTVYKKWEPTPIGVV